MKNEYSFEHFQKRREEIKNKNNANSSQKSLLRLFLSTFAIVLFSFLVIATIISPRLNIPALSDDTENIDDVSSSDFKSRIDYRLKEIQNGDESKMSSRTEKMTSESAESTNTKDSLLKVDLSTFETPQLPEKTYSQVNSNYNNTNNSNNMVQKIPVNPYNSTKPKQAPVPSQQVPAPYIPKTPQKNYKILVGDYSTPEEAKKISELFSTAGAKPMVKNIGGTYSVQVGAYNDMAKAQNLAGAYKSKNYKVKVVED